MRAIFCKLKGDGAPLPPRPANRAVALVGALVVVTVALVYNNVMRDARYPKYW